MFLHLINNCTKFYNVQTHARSLVSLVTVVLEQLMFNIAECAAPVHGSKYLKIT
jgi:hypothetical protein